MTQCPQCGADLSTPCRRKAHAIGGMSCRLLSSMKKIEELQCALSTANIRIMELEIDNDRLSKKLRDSMEDE